MLTNGFFYVVASFLAGLIHLVSLPIYKNFLSEPEFFCVGLGFTLWSIISLLDAGLTPIITKHQAGLFSTGKKIKANITIVSRRYFFLLGITALCVSMLFDLSFLGEHLVGDPSLVDHTLLACIILYFTFALIENTNKAQLAAIGQHSKVNAIYLFSNLSKPLLIITIFYFFQPSIKIFFSVYLTTSVFSNVLYSVSINKILTGKHVAQSLSHIEKKDILYHAILIITGTLTVQIDKLVLANFLTTKEFNQYFMLFSMSQLMLRLVMPAFQSIYPEMLMKLPYKTINEKNSSIGRLQGYLAIVLLSGALALFLEMDVIANVWLQKPLTVQDKSILVILTSAVFFQLSSLVRYFFLLSEDKLTKVAIISCLTFTIQISLLLLTINIFGIYSAPLSICASFLFSYLCILYSTFDRVEHFKVYWSSLIGTLYSNKHYIVFLIVLLISKDLINTPKSFPIFSMIIGFQLLIIIFTQRKKLYV